MPLLLRPSPVAGRALAWRGGSRDTAAASRALAPLAAVRHLFRDHSSSSHGTHYGLHQRHHQQPHHRHPNYRKAPELSSDWAALHLGAKLALWSGLCYFPYETIPRTLQEEGLRLVAYGRTSFTCWYVADGCIDFEALPRRAFQRWQPLPPPPPQQQLQKQGLTDPSVGANGSGAVDDDGSSSSTTTASTSSGSSSNNAHEATRPSALPLSSSLKADRLITAEGSAKSRETGAATPASASGSGRPGGGFVPARSRSHEQGGHHGEGPGHSQHHHHHHHQQALLRDGHIHLNREQPRELHLQYKHPHPRSRGGHDGVSAWVQREGGGAAQQQQQPLCHVAPTAAVTPGTRCRFIFLRGVQWAAPDTNTLALSASLAAFWPSPLLRPPPTDTVVSSARGAPAAAASSASGGSSSSSPSSSPATSSGSTPSITSFFFGSSPPASSSPPPASASSSSAPSSEHLVAHTGVAAMARELLPVLLPHIRDAAAAGVEHVLFAGHSLGGSLAQLLWATSILQGHGSPDATSVHTFGSPPVLAHAAGGGGGRVLRLLRSPPAAAVNWVLEHDPVPRALLTADPYFAAARRSVPGLAALLSLRGAVLGEGSAVSSGRFLYETVGEQLLLRWSSRGGCEVVPVSEAEAESLLRMALDEPLSSPVRSLQYWLDHHHASYHHDLEAAALTAFRRQVRSRQRSSAEEAAAAACGGGGHDGSCESAGEAADAAADAAA